MKKLSDKFSLALATLFGIGYTPLCPGTAACLVAVLLFGLIKSPVLFLIITLLSVIISFPISERAEKIYKVKDCKKIVIDDFAGMLVTYLFVPRDIRFIIAGFFLFRMFDMLKIPPADRMEKLPGSKGIVGDDLVAGVYSNIALQIVRIFV